MDFSGVIGQVREVVQIAESIKARYDALKANPAAASDLYTVYTDIASHLQAMALQDRDILDRFPPHQRSYFIHQIDHFVAVTARTTERVLRKLKRMQGNPLYSITHAKHNEAAFSELTDQTTPIQQSIQQLSGMLALAALSEQNASEIKTSMADGLHAALEHIETKGAAAPKDWFHAAYTAPRNSKLIIIDFASEGVDGAPLTCEGKLKRSLLESEAGCSVGVVAYGPSGVGKTCAVRAIAADPDVLKRFPGGVYLLSLGKDGTIEKLIQQLCKAVDASGGKHLSQELRQEQNVDMVIQNAQEWFQPYSCLFILDDIWRSNDLESDILMRLSILASDVGGKYEGSRLLYTTRDEELAMQGSAVSFEPRDALGWEASRILLRVAGVEDADIHAELRDPVCCQPILGILKICSGLPVALNLCGTGVGWKRRAMRRTRKNAWNVYLRTFRRLDLVKTRTNDNYTPFGVALLVSLDFLDKRASEDGAAGQRLTYREMHRALCILQKQDWIPASALRLLWGMADEFGKEDAMVAMASVGVADAEYRIVTGRECLGLRLHDLVHDFAQYQAEKNGEMLKWYETILEGYKSQLPDGIGRHTSWPAVVVDDGYFVRNVCRMLQSAMRYEEVFSLLSCPQWIVKMIAMNSILQLEGDFEHYEEWRRTAECELAMTCSSDRSSASVGKESTGAALLKTLCKIARMSLSHSAGNAVGAWFQLYARLLSTGTNNTHVQKLISEVEIYAPKPWVKALTPCLKGANDALVETFQVPYDVMSVCYNEEQVAMSCGRKHRTELFVARHFANGESKIVRLKSEFLRISQGVHLGTNTAATNTLGSGSSGGIRSNPRIYASCAAICRHGHFVSMGFSDGSVRVWGTENGELVCDAFHGHSDKVQSVAICPEGTFAASGSRDGTVRIWSTETGEHVGPPLVGHTNRVWSVALSATCTRVVSGSDDCSVQVWDVQTGRLAQRHATGHTDFVMSVAISRDGGRVVSGSSDRTVRVWDDDQGSFAKEPLVGHTDWVYSVAVSPDGARVVSGSRDRTIRVWDAETGTQLGKPLTGHAGSVLSVVISNDSTRVLSGSIDRTVRVWDAEAKEQVGVPTNDGMGSVMSVGVSTDGTLVVSGSRDGTVRLWDGNTGKQIGVPLMGHTNSVLSLAVSADCSRVVSGSQDRAVRVWNAMTGEQIGKPLTGHDGFVWSVAINNDGTRVLSESYDGTVYLWEVHTGLCVHMESEESHNWDELCRRHLGARPGPSQTASGTSDRDLRFEVRGNEIVLHRRDTETIVASFEEEIEKLEVSTEAATLAVILRSKTLAILKPNI